MCNHIENTAEKQKTTIQTIIETLRPESQYVQHRQSRWVTFD